jgi:2-isopropylmalate synthase
VLSFGVVLSGLSQLNSEEVQAMTEHVIVFDTTLRDGEQSPGASMNLEEKIRIAEMLEEMRVDVIEAGFPISSPGDFEAVHEIAKLLKTSVVCGLARAVRADIERVADAIKPATDATLTTGENNKPPGSENGLEPNENGENEEDEETKPPRTVLD